MTNKFSIKDLELLSGVKAHTIRIWEQRYNLLRPARTDSNIRTYSNEDLKLLLNISLLNNHGVKISKIANLNEEQIANEVSKLMNLQENSDELMNRLLLSLLEMSEATFDSAVDESIEKKGFKETVLQLLFPLLEKIGLMWQTGTIVPAQEHFISNLIRRKLFWAIESKKNNIKPTAKQFLLYLPENELHELTLLFYMYVLSENGHKTTYLGQSVPFEDLKVAITIVQPDALVSVITNPLNDSTLEEYIGQCTLNFPTMNFYFSGYQISLLPTLPTSGSIHLLPKATTMLEKLTSL